MKQENEFYVTGIGASAGGLDAVQQLFDNIPNNTGVAYVIIQHLSPDFKSLMPELLAKYTEMQIFTAENGQKIQPNCIYLNQRSKNIGIEDGKFILLDKAPKNHLNLPIDILFHTLGENFNDKAIGVILSGTGSDGSRGIKTIKEAGGTILVQDPTSAQFDGMPNSAILTNLPDFVLPPNELAEKIIAYTSKRLNLSNDDEFIHTNEKTFENILSEIQKYAGIDFKKYKTNTLLRRLEKRMSLHNISTLNDYFSFLKKTDKEKAAISQEFLIGVTSFFRDSEAFDVIAQTVVPTICQSKSNGDYIRIWIAGCSSGEEVYSIAILFEEYIKQNKLGLNYKIFATDIDKSSLQIASTGSYPVNNIAEIDELFLKDYFLKSGGRIQIIKRIREKIVFSYHDVTKDPPFIKTDLVSCRNLLIYFTNKTQKKVLHNFQFALNKNGFLFLGSSESLGEISKRFKTIDSKQKVFQNLHEQQRLSENKQFGYNQFNIGTDSLNYKVNYQNNNFRNRTQEENFYYKYLSKKHAPVTVFIDKDFNVHFIIGEFKKWFSQTDGVFTNNLLNMVAPELATIIRNGIRRVIKSQKSVSIENLVCDINGENLTTNLYFEYVQEKDSASDLFLVQFGTGHKNSTDEQVILTNNDVTNFSKQRIEDLELELDKKAFELQNVVEELETSNEELQSSNEELMSSNEELQSSNEELQSVNEELYTVNTEFQEKNKNLEDLNNDIDNLLNSNEIGTLFLDVNLNIRKFTPTVKEIFNLESNDIGRSITSFASEFDDNTRKTLIADTKTALEQLKTFEKEIKDSKGNWYLKRISPFITSEKKIEGVVVTFININKLKKAKSDLFAAETKLTEALEAGNMAWWEMELPSGAIRFNKNKAVMLGRKPEDFKHYKDFMELVHPDDYESTMQAMHKLINGEKEVYECQYRMKHIKNNYLWFQDVGRITSKSKGKIIMSGIVSNINKQKQTELILKDNTLQLSISQQIANLGSWELNTKTLEITLSAEHQILLGEKPKTRTMPLFEYAEKYVIPEDIPTIKERLDFAIENNDNIAYSDSFGYRVKTQSNDVKCFLVKSRRKIKDIIYGATQDITKEKQAELALQESEQKLSALVNNAADGLLVFNPKTGVEYVSNSYLNIGGYSEEEEYRRTEQDISKLIHPDDTEKTLSMVYNAIENKEQKLEYTYRWKHKKGHYIWRKDKVTFEYDENGQYLKAYMVCSDITKEVEAKQQKEYLSAIIENTENICVIKDLELKVIATNDSFAKAAGKSSVNDLIGKTDAEIFNVSPDEEPIKGYMTDEKKAQRLKKGERILREEPIFYPDGTKHTLLTYKFPIFNQDKLISTGNVSTDITDLKRIEQELKEANNTKDRFISIMAHDLRSPFNSILGFSNLLAKNVDKYDNVRITKLAKNIHQSATNTYNLLLNLLEWSRSQRDDIPFKPREIYFHHLVQDTYLLSKQTADEKNIKIEIEISPEITFEADQEMIKTVLRNLLSNAIKYTTQNGKILISAKQNHENIVIHIKDNGIGMSDEIRNSLFKIDKTKSKDGTNGEHGTGFGLLLSKEFVDKHNGKIEIESQLDKGSEFIVTLPLKQAKEQIDNEIKTNINL